MTEGVEWALHCCLNLAWVGPDRAVTATRLAAFHELPPAYLNKQLQPLARAEILTSTPGPRGGFRLAQAPERITLLDVVTAIEGSTEVFRCTEIRQQGPLAGSPELYRDPCLIHAAMQRAELAWRRELAGQNLDDLTVAVSRARPGLPDRVRRWFHEAAG
ncbi:Rrf2 family transcriptional regulator [Natronosporangium hydrolyticum]|uniref:Rrf2 family transcriptional regulator n=2 Tax=Natronosporangium hydrolyticum TaxID=2811111 RepID=A0A895YP45_9ACTN|nr:Rrf2 family transcriptional regulator [Natronosporangium hydrolyticum]